MGNSYAMSFFSCRVGRFLVVKRELRYDDGLLFLGIDEVDTAILSWIVILRERGSISCKSSHT
jgi:hypothetical protein